MPASLAVAPAAVTVARSVLLSNQFPPLYDAASGGHHLTLAPRLVGFIRLVVIVCAAIFGLQAGCEASFGQYRSTLHLTPWWGAFYGRRLRRALCCDIWVLGRLQGSFCSISQHTSSGGEGPPVQPDLSDKYCAAILPVLGLDSASRVRYRSTHLGRGARDVRELGPPVRFGSSDKYCAAISGF